MCETVAVVPRFIVVIVAIRGKDLFEELRDIFEESRLEFHSADRRGGSYHRDTGDTCDETGVVYAFLHLMRGLMRFLSPPPTSSRFVLIRRLSSNPKSLSFNAVSRR